MNKLGCRCDRKEHIVNQKIKNSNFLEKNNEKNISDRI